MKLRYYKTPGCFINIKKLHVTVFLGIFQIMQLQSNVSLPVIYDDSCCVFFDKSYSDCYSAMTHGRLIKPFLWLKNKLISYLTYHYNNISCLYSEFYFI